MNKKILFKKISYNNKNSIKEILNKNIIKE